MKRTRGPIKRRRQCRSFGSMLYRTTASGSEARHRTYSLIFTSARTGSVALCCIGISGGYNVN
eukprot:6003183-Karenia_brevis.AAC.1